MSKAKKQSIRRYTRSNLAPVVRGAYREWDEHAMECALSQLAEKENCKNAHLIMDISMTAKKWGIPRKILARYFYTPG